MHPARQRAAMALLASLAVVLAPSAGCGGDDDQGGDGGTNDSGANGKSDAAEGPIDAAPDAGFTPCQPTRGTNLGLEPVASGFEDGFDEPVFVTSPPGDPRLFVVSKHGAISIVENGRVLDTPFLAINDRVASDSGERGLLGLAFHPQFAENHRFFLFYTADDSNFSSPPDRLSEFRVMEGNPDVADPESERHVLTVPDDEPNHNGGMIAFGRDGYLYIGLGDGGGGGDSGTAQHPPQGNGQDKTTLLGDMLRIDVNGAEPYTIPSDNPYATSTACGDAGRQETGECAEIFLSGVRNPWRWSFDRDNGDLYIGDVGQGRWEEVDVLPAGQQSAANLGWRIMEGNECFQAATCDDSGLTRPVAVYQNPGGETGAAVVGGYVYRGSCYPDIEGWYFYGDFPTHRMWTFAYAGAATEEREVTTEIDPDGVVSGLSSFGEDASGELYVVSMQNGSVFHITAGP